MLLMKFTSIFLALIVSSTATFAKEPLDYRLRIPASFEQISAISQLADSLSSGEYRSRFVALLRLIEIDDIDALPHLESAYENDPFQESPLGTLGYPIDYYALFGIGRIGGVQARNYLWNVANNLTEPRILVHPVGDTIAKIMGVFEGLCCIENPDSANYFLRIAEENAYWITVRMCAYESFLKLYLKNDKFRTEDDSLIYLLDESRSAKAILSEKPQNDSKGHYSLEYVRDRGLTAVIIHCYKDEPDLFARYQGFIPSGDPFMDEFHRLQKIIDYHVADKLRDEQSRQKGQ